MRPYDTIIVGGGHNGLTSAAYLARAGRRVLVLEQHEEVGGFCATMPIPGAPGFLGSPFALDFVLANVAPTVDVELGLHGFGLRWVSSDAIASYLLPDGPLLTLWRDRDRTVRDMARISPRDAAAYEVFAEVMWSALRAGLPYLQGHPRRVAPRALADILRHAVRGRRSLATAAGVLASSVDEVIEERFESDQVKALLATLAAFALAPLEEPGSAFALVFGPMEHEVGVRRPVGGSGAYTRALADCVRAHGGEIRTSAAVAEITVTRGRAHGVALCEGTRFAADTVVAALDPYTLLTRLVPGNELPSGALNEALAAPVLHAGISLFTGNVALSRAPVYPPALAVTGSTECVVLGTGLEQTRTAMRVAREGRLPEDFPVWTIIPSLQDRTLVPAGSDGESVYVYPSPVPYEPAAGDWAQLKDTHLDRCIALWDGFAPGTAESVVGARATSPADMARYAYKGHWSHIDLVASRMGPRRPFPSLAGHRTPIQGLWHAGAGAHPAGTVNGWSGRTVAREVLRAC